MKCPYCAEDIRPSARKCRHCGEWLERAEGRSGSGSFQRGTADARSVKKGLKEKELDDFGQKFLFFLLLCFCGWLWYAFNWGIALGVLIAGIIGISYWYYKE